MSGALSDLLSPEVGLDVATGAEAVWSVLCDGWSYPLWVVGATHMRDVDEAWPAVGARLHHSVGLWPFQLSDTTVVRRVEDGSLLDLEARAFPAGTARVVLRLTPTGPDRCRVTIHEYARGGLGRFVPVAVQSPLIRARNTESLSRLADIARRRPASSRRG
ncbi:SRPBCC family protein [Actinomycetospora sp.]|jgi:hypothetical protein|uniref:SRPBCC family protein n=1 Tax=Actinomycetospora sp. TaxID=1872135 RepID=UPI002F403682